MARQRRHYREQRELPLFQDASSAPGLFNDNGEQDVGNPMLASWGKLGRDYIYLLAGLERYQELDAFVDIEPDNLLHNLQYDVLELKNSAVAGRTAEEFAWSGNKRTLATMTAA